MKSTEIYPLTVVKDRYNGEYSDAKYLAFNLSPWDVPCDIAEDDTDTEFFWGGSGAHDTYNIGKGNSPESAILDLQRILFE